MVKKYGDLYLDVRRTLLETEDAQSAGMIARQLVCHFTGKNQEYILANRDLYASEEAVIACEKALKRLLEGEPLAYVLGEWEFYGLPLKVTSDVLIPRDDTCAVAALAIRQGLFLDQDPRILDLCCGSGCIGLAVASRVKDAKVTLADISQKALSVAKENVALNKLSGRVRCVAADALKPAFPFLGKFDMIVSNPPYITGREMEELPKSVADYEPHLALYGGEDGLDFYRAVCRNFAPALNKGGVLAFEVGLGQFEDVMAIMTEAGYTNVQFRCDLAGIERVVWGTWEPQA